ncbi:hypothetical protein B0T19DRAFT_429466 [Cercophora scortea]|uniref:Aminoglycoside phosphotransferase domain-containing protein n=1 Tax=Cercophora scortea TaxID=314031 RepID=A0AAE0MBC6_9PEZI|nr:hypothetical protein B0T19DRAFT_429466 [Cercophora scortea]
MSLLLRQPSFTYQMASVEQRDLVPDEKILSAIFPGATDIKLTSCCNIISNTFDTCTFSIHLEIAPLSGYPKDLLVRLETSGSRLATVAALQRLGHAQLPNLIPSVLDVGTTTTADGTPVEYSVTAYCTGTITLEDVWDTLGQPHQLESVDSVVHAMEKLQKLDRNSEDVSRSLTGTPYVLNNGASDCMQSVRTSIGGPKLGYFPDVKQFLGGILRASNLKSPNCTLSEIDDGIVLVSAFEDIGRVEFTRSDLDNLQHHVVFCHNDLEPRNILVREISSAEGKSPQYELAAIIDWEMAGFFPFAYEYGLKDTVLGSSNLSFSWYSLFKERTSHLLPRAEYHTKLIKALKIVDESKKRSMTRNVGIRFQAKWVGREDVEKSLDLRRGWVRKAGAKPPGRFTKADQANLELEVLKELGYL